MRYFNIVLSAASLLLVLYVLSATPALAIADPFDPYKVALGPEGNIYALFSGNDYVNSHIYVFAPDGREIRTIEASVNDMALDAAGNLYTSGTLNICSVSKIDKNGKATLLWYNDSDYSLATGTIAVSSGGDVCFSIFHLQSGSGEFDRCDIYRMGADGIPRVVYSRNLTSRPGIFTTLAIDANGTIYGAGTGNQITVISPDGTTKTLGKLGSANGTFSMINAVAVGGDGYLYVTESGNRRVQKLATDGAFVAKWEGCGPDRFAAPRSVAADKNGRVYVADVRNRRIVWLTPDYSFGLNVTENMMGQGTAWGNVVAGANYTTWQQEIRKENEATPTPGFSPFAALAGLCLAGAVLGLWFRSTRQ